MTKKQRPKVKSIAAAIRSLVTELETGGRVVISKRRNLNTNSLILRASSILKKNGFVVCHADFKGTKNSGEFLERLHDAYLSGFFSRKSDLEKYKANWLKNMMKIYERLRKSTDLAAKPDLSVFDFSEKDWFATIDLVEKFAKGFRKKPIVFLENFDVMCGFKDSMKLQESLRSCIQHHGGIGYCYSVSSIKREIEIFHSYSAPFYLSASRLTI